MNYLDYNCQDRKILNDGHLKKFLAAYTGWRAGNIPQHFWVAFHYVGPTFINAYIFSTGGRSMFYKHLLLLGGFYKYNKPGPQ